MLYLYNLQRFGIIILKHFLQNFSLLFKQLMYMLSWCCLMLFYIFTFNVEFFQIIIKKYHAIRSMISLPGSASLYLYIFWLLRWQISLDHMYTSIWFNFLVSAYEVSSTDEGRIWECVFPRVCCSSNVTIFFFLCETFCENLAIIFIGLKLWRLKKIF